MDNVVAESKKVRLRVLTPLRVVYNKPVEMVIARTSEGDMGVLYGHDTRSALLGDGVLRIFEEGRQNEEILMVLGGILSVENNDVAIISEIAEHPDKMQEFLHKLEEERKTSELVEQTTDLYTKRMEVAIRQALVHMDVSAYPMVKNTDSDG
jgi:F-type H+-transporting ATPase subunit epsilon